MRTLLLASLLLSACGTTVVGNWAVNPLPATLKQSGITSFDLALNPDNTFSETIVVAHTSAAANDPLAGCSEKTFLIGEYSGATDNVVFNVWSASVSMTGCQNSASDILTPQEVSGRTLNDDVADFSGSAQTIADGGAATLNVMLGSSTSGQLAISFNKGE